MLSSEKPVNEKDFLGMLNLLHIAGPRSPADSYRLLCTGFRNVFSADVSRPEPRKPNISVHSL